MRRALTRRGGEVAAYPLSSSHLDAQRISPPWNPSSLDRQNHF